MIADQCQGREGCAARRAERLPARRVVPSAAGVAGFHCTEDGIEDSGLVDAGLARQSTGRSSLAE